MNGTKSCKQEKKKGKETEKWGIEKVVCIE